MLWNDNICYEIWIFGKEVYNPDNRIKNAEDAKKNIILLLLFVHKDTSFSKELSLLSKTSLRSYSTIHIILCEHSVKKEYMTFRD